MAPESAFFLRGSGEASLPPERFPSAAIQAGTNAPMLLGQGRDGKQAIVPDDRRGVADTGQLNFPGHVAFSAPRLRNVRLEAGSIQSWSAPARPIFGEGSCRVEKEHGHREEADLQGGARHSERGM